MCRAKACPLPIGLIKHEEGVISWEIQFTECYDNGHQYGYFDAWDVPCPTVPYRVGSVRWTHSSSCIESWKFQKLEIITSSHGMSDACYSP